MQIWGGFCFFWFSHSPFYPGLCGNFNSIETDDFRTISGIVEDSASAFGNSWKIMASCADVQDVIEDPCLKSMDKGAATTISF